MEFSWTSFILEIINFLVLVWILKYFFYRPVQQVLLKRKQAVQDTLDKAQNMYDAAHELQAQYENRLHIWDNEKEQQRKVFEQSLDEWKVKQQTEFTKKLARDKEKMAEQQRHSLSSIINHNAKEALLNASKFSAKFLMSFADKDLEKKCVDKVINELSALSNEQRDLLRNSLIENEAIRVESAYQIDEPQKISLIEVLHKLFDAKVPVLFQQNPDLLAGLNIKSGSFSVQANLRDELAFFAEIENG